MNYNSNLMQIYKHKKLQINQEKTKSIMYG